MLKRVKLALVVPVFKSFQMLKAMVVTSVRNLNARERVGLTLVRDGILEFPNSIFLRVWPIQAQGSGTWWEFLGHCLKGFWVLLEAEANLML